MNYVIVTIKCGIPYKKVTHMHSLAGGRHRHTPHW